MLVFQWTKSVNAARRNYYWDNDQPENRNPSQMRHVRFRSMTTQPSSEFQGPKPGYWGNAHYRNIVRSNEAQFLLVKSIESEIDKIKAGILKSSLIAQVAGLLLTTYLIAAVIVFLGVFIFLMMRPGTEFLSILLVLAILYYGLKAGFSFFDGKYKQLEESIISRNSSRFQHLELKLRDARIQSQKAEKSILSAWDTYCVDYENYPPDWSERKELVKSRDDNKCTNCGWPTGFIVYRRNLHVHHIKNLSDGGDNSTDNLTTLCHVCHKQQEGSGHKRIKYVKRRRR